MICEGCHGRGMRFSDEMGLAICSECGGCGVAYCCDAAGAGMSHFSASNDAAKGDTPAASYADDRYPERACDRCGKSYRGPAVYCSLACALADA